MTTATVNAPCHAGYSTAMAAVIDSGTPTYSGSGRAKINVNVKMATKRNQRYLESLSDIVVTFAQQRTVVVSETPVTLSRQRTLLIRGLPDHE